jgi:hypothetical protein
MQRGEAGMAGMAGWGGMQRSMSHQEMQSMSMQRNMSHQEMHSLHSMSMMQGMPPGMAAAAMRPMVRGRAVLMFLFFYTFTFIEPQGALHGKLNPPSLPLLVHNVKACSFN